MKVKTRAFGEVDINDEKILTFDDGIMGFEDMKQWTILFDNTKGDKTSGVSWLQCIDDPTLAIPVISPFLITEDYKPFVDDELLKPLGEFRDEDLITLLALSVPAGRPKDTTANFKAPFLINTDNRKGIQIVVNNEDYEIRTNVRESIGKMKNKRA